MPGSGDFQDAQPGRGRLGPEATPNQSPWDSLAVPTGVRLQGGWGRVSLATSLPCDNKCHTLMLRNVCFKYSAVRPGWGSWRTGMACSGRHCGVVGGSGLLTCFPSEGPTSALLAVPPAAPVSTVASPPPAVGSLSPPPSALGSWEPCCLHPTA